MCVFATFVLNTFCLNVDTNDRHWKINYYWMCQDWIGANQVSCSTVLCKKKCCACRSVKGHESTSCLQTEAWICHWPMFTLLVTSLLIFSVITSVVYTFSSIIILLCLSGLVFLVHIMSRKNTFNFRYSSSLGFCCFLRKEGMGVTSDQHSSW